MKSLLITLTKAINMTVGTFIDNTTTQKKRGHNENN